MFSNISSYGTIKICSLKMEILWAWRMFSGISSCGTLRFAPWKSRFHALGACLVGFLLVAH